MRSISLFPLTQETKRQISPIKSNSEHAFVFDIDDTLYCQSTGISALMRKGIYEYAASKGIPEDQIRELCESYSHLYGLAVKGFCKHFPNTDTDEFYKKVDGSIKLENFITKDLSLRELIEQIPFTKVCFTNATIQHAMNVLTALDIADCFDAIFYCQYDSSGEFICKPDADSYAIIEAYCNVLPSNIYFYDDNLRNIESARARNWKATLINRQNPIKPILLRHLSAFKLQATGVSDTHMVATINPIHEQINTELTSNAQIDENNYGNI